ncbi:histidine-rich glycoprotein [Leptonychotes weddellii]|uniref:Histidine-rich glycoprotein n=1 Tax=Leptonychotes weddellii TaxID=9713 RepID=A0A7F8PWY0_LEPWE|nr:histidine-rich glycoprotein [Leptonychotes weddellii]
MSAFRAALLLIPLIAMQNSGAVSPSHCDATEPFAGKVLDQLNKGRRQGYLFQLLRVADAHVDKAESVAVYYLVLDVKESDCSVLSGKHWDDCEPALSKRVSDIVIGQCKVIATQCLNDSQHFRVNDYNCTTSSVSSALASTKDSPLLFDFLEEPELYRKLADKALEKYQQENGDFASFRVDHLERVVRWRGEERTNYYVDFSVRNCSRRRHFPRHPYVFGFCRADLSYDVGVSDLETPEDIAINCEVFNFEECRNISGVPHPFGHPHRSGRHEHSLAGKPPFKPDEFRDHHHPHKPHKFECPPLLEDRPPFQAGAPPVLPPPGSRCHHPHFGTSGTHGHPHNHSSSEHHPHRPPHHGFPHHGPPPQEPPPHGPPSHGPPPHGPPPHGHHHHGHHPHGHHPHGHHPHRHHPRGHHPHGHHPHGHDFLDHGPCDSPPHSQGRRAHGPPSRHSKVRGPGKRPFRFHWRQIGYVYQLPPLKEGEVLPFPEANFPSFSLPGDNNPLKPEIQPFPQSVSESCPGTFKSEFSHVLKFFAYLLPK